MDSNPLGDGRLGGWVSSAFPGSEGSAGGGGGVEVAVVPVDDGLGRDSFSSAFPGSDESMATGDGGARDDVLCKMLFANGGRGRAGLNFPIIGLNVGGELPNNP